MAKKNKQEKWLKRLIKEYKGLVWKIEALDETMHHSSVSEQQFPYELRRLQYARMVEYMHILEIRLGLAGVDYGSIYSAVLSGYQMKRRNKSDLVY